MFARIKLGTAAFSFAFIYLAATAAWGWWINHTQSWSNIERSGWFVFLICVTFIVFALGLDHYRRERGHPGYMRGG